MPEIDEVRAAVLTAAKELYDRGLVSGTAGNVSGAGRRRTASCSRPSSVPYRGHDHRGPGGGRPRRRTVLEGHRSPTSEMSLHLECYRRYPEVGGRGALPRQARLDVRRGPPPHPRRHRRVRHLHRRRRPCARVPAVRKRRTGRGGRRAPRRSVRGAHGQPRPAVRRQGRRRCTALRAGRGAQRPDHVGRRGPRRRRAAAGEGRARTSPTSTRSCVARCGRAGPDVPDRAPAAAGHRYLFEVREIPLNILRGFFMGAADIVPGVSGGTVALVLRHLPPPGHLHPGRIRRPSAACSRATSPGPSKPSASVDWAFLVPLLAGIGIAVLALASLIEHLLERSPRSRWPGCSRVSCWARWWWPGACSRSATPSGSPIGVGAGSRRVPAARAAMPGPPRRPSARRATRRCGPTSRPGAVAICAMILPGISGSFILVMLGMYGPVLGAVSDRDLVTVAARRHSAASSAWHSSPRCCTGRWSTTTTSVMAALIGLMLGSLRVLWPWPDGRGQHAPRAPPARPSARRSPWPWSASWWCRGRRPDLHSGSADPTTTRRSANSPADEPADKPADDSVERGVPALTNGSRPHRQGSGGRARLLVSGGRRAPRASGSAPPPGRRGR